jgi:hypothetical protein
MAAVLAVGMVGGIAVAAGTGVLTPFGGDDPDPGASVSAAVTAPERPMLSPSPSEPERGGSAPDDTPSGAAPGGAGGSGRGEARDDAAPKPDSGDRGDRPGDSRRKIASACRDLRDGKRLNADRRRALRDAAGSTRVGKYCKGVLSTAGSRSTERNDEDTDKGRHQGKDRDRKQDRKQDKAERKADRMAEKRAEKMNDDDETRTAAGPGALSNPSDLRFRTP